MKLTVLRYNPRVRFLVDELRKRLAGKKLKVEETGDLSGAELAERIQDTDILLVTPHTGRVDGDMMDVLPELKLLLTWGDGYEQINVAESSRRGIPVCNAGAYSNPDVAEMALTLIFACGRKLLQHVRLVGENRGAERTSLHPIHRLAGRMVGLLGFGAIARELCWRLRGVGFEVQASDPYVDAEVMEHHGVSKVDEQTLFATSDFLSLHLRLNDETRGIVSEQKLRLMKSAAFLINVSRGALVDEEALARAVGEGRIAGAGLDVLINEPASQEDPLFRIPGITITPHAGAGTAGSHHDQVENWVKVVEDFLEGKRPLHNQVNPEIEA